jgi:predicted dehydrogenase
MIASVRTSFGLGLRSRLSVPRDELAHAFKGRPAGTIDEALADPAVGAVAVCLPHALKALVALRALGAGKHVLCEKLLATSLEQADLMIAGAAAGRILMVAENVWFEPPLVKLRELVAAGVIGPVSLVQIARDAWLDNSDLDERPWFRSGHKAPGGIMMSGGIHDIEMARMLAGEISAILAVRAPSVADDGGR